MYEITVAHSIDTGHRVVGHEDGKGKCARLHGHTYGFRVTLQGPDLDAIGFVTDFGVVKAALDEWDHRFVVWDRDPLVALTDDPGWLESQGLVRVPFNPTAENMARHFAERFRDLGGVSVATVEVSETPKTTARFTARDAT